MNIVIEFLRGLVALFVDDELLAIGVLGVVGVTVVLINVIDAKPIVAGTVLLGGNILVLVVGVVRTVRRTVVRDAARTR